MCRIDLVDETRAGTPIHWYLLQTTSNHIAKYLFLENKQSNIISSNKKNQWVWNLFEDLLLCNSVMDFRFYYHSGP